MLKFKKYVTKSINVPLSKRGAPAKRIKDALDAK